jgi:hypothetical protein
MDCLFLMGIAVDQFKSLLSPLLQSTNEREARQ